MSNMVIFQTPDGSPGYNQFESVDEAVSFVEKLRNEQGIENARMFALEEIKFELKPYFKVELQALNPGASPSTTSPSAPSAASPSSPSATPTSSPTPLSPSAPAAAPAPSSEPTSFGSAAPTPLAEPAPAPSQEPTPAPTPPTQADAPSSDQPTRRGLFGR